MTSAQAAAADVRKTVTVLFTDLVDWSPLGRQLDPEALRRLMSRYFQEMQAVVERHGGTVEKFIGDAVMAVFGIPDLHEDDALRAVRAAAEMREALAALNEELERTWGVRLKGRIGVNSGEVVAGDQLQGHLFVTGEVVNVAKRLEEAAGASEILISEATHRLVRDAVVAEQVEERTTKGGRSIDGLRLVAVLPHAAGHARRFDSPLVDREQQLNSIFSIFTSVVDNRSCHLLTVLGRGRRRQVAPRAGVRRPRSAPTRRCCAAAACPTARASRTGRSRRSFASCSDRRSTSGKPSPETIAALLPGEERADLIAERISEALGRGRQRARHGEETFWAVRKLFEVVAQRVRSSSSSTTSSGRSRPSSSSSTTSRSSRATPRSCCSAWRGPRCSTAIPAGAAAS